MKALENPSYTLTQLLDAGKAMELSKSQAASIEDKQSVNKLSRNNGSHGQGNRTRNANSKQDGADLGRSRSVDQRSRDRKSSRNNNDNRKSSGKCRNCGRDYPHPGGKTACPAYQTICRGCGKSNHFEAVCRSKDKGESRSARRSTVNKVNDDDSSDENEAYIFTLSTEPTSKDQPLFQINIHGTPVTVMADS